MRWFKKKTKPTLEVWNFKRKEYQSFECVGILEKLKYFGVFSIHWERKEDAYRVYDEDRGLNYVKLNKEALEQLGMEILHLARIQRPYLADMINRKRPIDELIYEMEND